jgi:hypothetical protein
MNLSSSQVSSAVQRYNLTYLYTAKYKHNSVGFIELMRILKEMFPDNDIVGEKYIKETKQFIDIFDETLSIAYEYNGIQHYQQKGTWNRSDKAWSLQLERDEKKKKWCDRNDIPLVVIRYDEDLNEDLIKNKLKELNLDVSSL